MAKIRVGMIRCDLHAIYYASLIQEHDPYLLREQEYGKGGYFYFYTYYNAPARIAFPMVSGFEITKLWDENRKAAENMSKIYLGKPKLCNSFEEVSDDVDLVFIPDCNGDGSDHLKLATPGIKKGVPTFIDKPFAYEVKDARELVKLAKKHKVPIMSLSILRELPHITRFRHRFAEIGQPEFGIIRAGNMEKMSGHIHAISLAQHLFGAGVESVECMGQTPLACVLLDYGTKANRPQKGVILCCASGGMYHCSFYASVYSSLGVIHSPQFSDFEFPWGCIKILKMVKKMVITHKPQVSYEEMIECIAIVTAARKAQKLRRKVYLKEVSVIQTLNKQSRRQ